MKSKPYCIWLFGMPNAGKTTIAYHLMQDRLRNVILIDGDQYRQHLSPSGFSFTREDIIKNNISAAKLSKFLMDQGFNVVVAMITPYNEGREKIKEIITGYPLLRVWLDASQETRESRPNYRESQIKFEMPYTKHFGIYLNTETKNIKYCLNEIYDCLENVQEVMK